MSSTETKIDVFENLHEKFLPRRKVLFHLAVQRICYRHHFLVLGDTWCSDDESCNIIHYCSCICEGSKGKVKKVKYTRENFEKDIREGLYFLENDNYPKTDDQLEHAYRRIDKSLRNKEDYSVWLNNCEHLVFYILTDSHVSFQVKNASCMKSWLMNFVEIFSSARQYLGAFAESSVRQMAIMGHFKEVQSKITEIFKIGKTGVIDKIRGMLNLLLRNLKSFSSKVSDKLLPTLKRVVERLHMLCKIDTGNVENIKKAFFHFKDSVLDCMREDRGIAIVVMCIFEVCFAYYAVTSLQDMQEKRKHEKDYDSEYFDREKTKVIFSCVLNILSHAFLSTLFTFSCPVIGILAEVIRILATRFLCACVIDLFNSIKSRMIDLYNGIKSRMTDLYNGIKSRMTDLYNGIKSRMTDLYNGIKSRMTDLFNGIKSRVTNLYNGIKSRITRSSNHIRGIVSQFFKLFLW